MSHPSMRLVCAALCATFIWIGTDARGDEAQPPKPSPAAADMLEAMREKGIITEQEYEDLYRRQAMYEIEQQQKEALPAWLRDWTFGGDATVRYDDDHRGGKIRVDVPLHSGQDPVDVANATASADSSRLRFRLRLGAERKLGEDWLVGFRVATATASLFGQNAGDLIGVDFTRRYFADPRTAFANAGDFFAPKSIGIDRVYIRWAPKEVDGLQLTVGKMPNPFVSPDWSGDFMVWDNDISPEGGALQYTVRLLDERAWVAARGGYFIIDTVPNATLQFKGIDGQTTSYPDLDEKDPFMYAAQLEMGGDILPAWRLATRVAYYDMRDINARTAAAMEALGNGGSAIDDNPLFRNLPQPYTTSGASRGHAREIVWDVYTRITPYEGWVFTPFYQLYTMLDASSENLGYSAGFDLSFPTNTTLSFMWASMPRNGTVALFTDFDFFDGFTNARGFGVFLGQQFNRWVSMRGSFFSSTIRNDNCTALLDTGQAALCDVSIWGGPFLADARKQVLDRQRYFLDLMVKF